MSAEQGQVNNNNANGGEGDGGGGGGWSSTLLRWIMMYYVINFFMSKFRGDAPTTQSTPKVDEEGNPIPIPTSSLPHSALWKANSKYNLRVYVSEEPDLFSVIYNVNADDHLVYNRMNVEYSCADNVYQEKEINLTLTNSLRNNGSYYAHIVMSSFGYPWDEKDEDFDETKVLYRTHPLISYRLKKKKVKKNLLSSSNDKDGDNVNEDNKKDEIINYWKPELTIRPLCDWTTYKANSIPLQIIDHYKIDVRTNKYWPVIYMDDFWLLGDKLIPIYNNNTLSIIPLKISLSPISQWKFMLQTQMESQYQQQAKWGMSSSEDNDEVRRLLMESNPYLLGVTMIVTLLHTVFDFLAFKNDIQFWHKTESVKGLSVRTIFINCFCQLIIFLYLLDQDTTWMILISSGVGFIIECWKITQAAKVSYQLQPYPWIFIKDKKTYSESDTDKYDKQAMKYLSYLLYPSLFCYTIYSLIYNEHKSIYSFIIGTLVSFIYMFGFIMMCPQLYLNYKLKSTAFMPWRMMTYKFLNTIIDDLFAFLIKMPTMHRLSCFRDDVIFLIFLYQKYLYRTDYERVNEYGFKMKQNSIKDNNDNNNIALDDNDEIDVDNNDKNSKKNK